MSQPDESGYLGSRIAKTVVHSAQNLNTPGGWLSTWDPLAPIEVEVFHIAMKGPAGSFDVYIDDSFYTTDTRSDRNEYDPSQPMPVRPGQIVSFHFSATAAPAPQVWLYLRQPQTGRTQL